MNSIKTMPDCNILRCLY